MRKHSPTSGKRRILVMLAALMALAVVVLPATALPVAATAPDSSADSATGTQADTVLALLGQLQRSDISPGWQPDIRANEGAVQALLDGYLACSAAEKAAFTETQNADLRAYFTALYAVQGKDAAGVDDLFAGAAAGGASSAPVSSAPESAASGDSSDTSGADSSAPPAADPTSQVDSAPAPVDAAASMPAAANQPQSPGGDGWFGFFSNQGLGITLIVVLVLLAAVLFIRFLVALRKAGKAPKDDDEDSLRAQELFGENYANNERLEQLQNGDAAAKPKKPALTGKAAPKAGTAPTVGSEEKTEVPQPKRNPLARLRGDTFNNAAVSTLPPEVDNPPPPGDGPAFRNLRAAFGKTVSLPDPDTGEPPEAAAETTAPTGGPGAKAPAPEAEPPLGRNPDRAEPITMRSFSAPPRTGRPGKMPFRQGEPDDLDAIDE